MYTYLSRIVPCTGRFVFGIFPPENALKVLVARGVICAYREFELIAKLFKYPGNSSWKITRMSCEVHPQKNALIFYILGKDEIKKAIDESRFARSLVPNQQDCFKFLCLDRLFNLCLEGCAVGGIDLHDCI